MTTATTAVLPSQPGRTPVPRSTASSSSLTASSAPLDVLMVRTWLRHDFTAWCSMVRRGDIHLPEALDTAAFETMQSSRAETAPDMRSLEAQLPDCTFKSEIQLELARRGDPPVVSSIFNKPAVLRRLQGDADPKEAALEYVAVSRGWIAAPPGRTLCTTAYQGNYVDPETSDPALVAAVDKELARSEAAGYLADWATVAVEDGCPEMVRPALMHPIGAYLKTTVAPSAAVGSTITGSPSTRRQRKSKRKFLQQQRQHAEAAHTTLRPVCSHSEPQPLLVKKARIFVDPGPSGLNDVDGSDDYTTQLASIADARSAVCRGVPFARGDFRDAFLGHSVALGQARYQGIQWRGRTLAFRKMILGHRRSPRQMQATLVAIIRSFHRELRTRGCPVQQDPEYHQRPPRNQPLRTPDGGVTATPGYVDDEACFATTVMAAWYSFAVWLHVCTDEESGWGLPLSFGAGKTCPPHGQQVFLGFLFDVHAMTISVPADKLARLVAKIDEFLRKEFATDEHNSVHSALSVAGSLQHVFTILPFGNAFYRGLLTTAMAVGRGSRHKAIECDADTIEDVRLCQRLLNTVSTANVITGLRRPRMFGAIYTDASLSGWCYHCAALGICERGVWPEHWLERINDTLLYSAIWITELEAIVALFALRRVLPFMRLHRCEMFVDNAGVVSMLNRLATCSRRIRPIITEIAFLCGAFDAEVLCKWIRSACNALADCGSRPEIPQPTLCDLCGRCFSSKYQQQHHWFTEHRARPSRTPALCEPARPELLPAAPLDLDTYGNALADVDSQEMLRLLPMYAVGVDGTSVAPPAFLLR